MIGVVTVPCGNGNEVENANRSLSAIGLTCLFCLSALVQVVFLQPINNSTRWIVGEYEKPRGVVSLTSMAPEKD